MKAVGFTLCKLSNRLQILLYDEFMKKQYRSEFSTRQNMRKEDYEIFFYSDSYFQSVSVHKHDYYEFYFPVSGKVEMEIRGKRTRLVPCDAVIVPPGTSHRAITENSEKSYSRYVFWISADYLREIAAIVPGISYIRTKAASQKQNIFHFSESEYALIQSKILRLIEEDHSEKYAAADFRHICIMDLLTLISRFIYEHDNPRPAEKGSDQIQMMIDFIETHLDEELSLERLGEQFFVSKYHIAHIFKDRTGMTVHRYIQKKRLERCADDIKSGKSLSQIHQTYGFGDYSSFFRAFRNEYGVSPKEYQSVYLLDPLVRNRADEKKGGD